MRQPVQRANAIAIQRLQRILDEAFDARFEIIYRRGDECDDEHFLVVAQRAALDDLCCQRRENMCFARARDSSNAKPPARIAEDLLLRGSRIKIKCHYLYFS